MIAPHTARLRLSVCATAFALVGLTGCRLDMHDSPRYEPLEASELFADHKAARQPVLGTVAQGQLFETEDPVLYTGKKDGAFVDELPFELTAADLNRGEQRYNIFCSPCHGRTGAGDGMIVQRGLKQPTSYHEARLLNQPLGYFYYVITNGYGTMYDYSARVHPRDRWLIAAYIRTLQLSNRGSLDDVPMAARGSLE